MRRCNALLAKLFVSLLKELLFFLAFRVFKNDSFF